MARGRHYAKLSLSNAARLSFSDLCILLFCYSCSFLFVVCNSMFARLGTDYEIRNQWFFAILEAMTTD